MESFELTQSPALEYLSPSQVQVNATADCKARVMLTGFPSPLHRGVLVDGGLSDGRYRENATPALLDMAVTGSLWGTEKSSQWYAVLAVAGSGDTTFRLKGMPVLRASSQAGQVITLRNNANTGNIGYGFTADELAGGKLQFLTGASRGLMRAHHRQQRRQRQRRHHHLWGQRLKSGPGRLVYRSPSNQFPLPGHDPE